MTITVVQSKAFNGASSGNFNANVAAGNTVFLYMYMYTNSGAAMSTSAPLFNGSPVTGASKLLDGQSPGSGATYSAIWMLPNVSGGAESIAITASGGVVDGNVGLVAVEVSGLGSAPVIDSGASPNPEVGTGNSSSVTSGATGNTTAAPEIVLGTAVIYGQNLTLPSSPWATGLQASSFCAASWQVTASSGSGYTYAPAAAGSASWIAGVVTVQPGGIVVVQTATNAGAPPPFSFASNVTAGNTVILAAAGYATNGIAVTSNTLTLGGSPVTGQVALFNPGSTAGVNSASSGGNIAYICIWMLPNCPSGQKTLNLSVDSGNNNIGQVAYEISGLGATPVLDKSSSGSSISSSSLDSGSTGAITAAPEFIVGASMIFSGAGAGVPSGFAVSHPSGDLWVGYQVAVASGGSYDWQQTSAGTPWSAALATVAAALPPAVRGLLLAAFP